jgi:hypothetical protein
MAIENGRRFLAAPRIRSEQADQRVRQLLSRLGVDAVLPLGSAADLRLNGVGVRNPARVTMRTREFPSHRPLPTAGT